MLKLIEIALACFFIYMVVKEIMVPWWQGGRAFPMFRKRRQLEGERARAVEEVLDSEIGQETKQIKKSNRRIKF